MKKTLFFILAGVVLVMITAMVFPVQNSFAATAAVQDNALASVTQCCDNIGSFTAEQTSICGNAVFRESQTNVAGYSPQYYSENVIGSKSATVNSTNITAQYRSKVSNAPNDNLANTLANTECKKTSVPRAETAWCVMRL